MMGLDHFAAMLVFGYESPYSTGRNLEVVAGLVLSRTRACAAASAATARWTVP